MNKNRVIEKEKQNAAKAEQLLNILVTWIDGSQQNKKLNQSQIEIIHHVCREWKKQIENEPQKISEEYQVIEEQLTP